jgi:hypothetical protein
MRIKMKKLVQVQEVENKGMLKLLLTKIWQSIFGYDHRLWFSERWDLSKIIVWKEYGGNEGFLD